MFKKFIGFFCLTPWLLFASDENLCLRIEYDMADKMIYISVPTEGIDELHPFLVLSYYTETESQKTPIIKDLTARDIERILNGKNVKKELFRAFLKERKLIIEEPEEKIEIPVELAQNIVEFFQGKRLSIREVVNKKYKIFIQKKDQIISKSYEISRCLSSRNFVLDTENIDLKTDLTFLSLLVLANWSLKFIDRTELIQKLKEEDLEKIPFNVRKNLKKEVDFGKVFEILRKGSFKIVKKGKPK